MHSLNNAGDYLKTELLTTRAAILHGIFFFFFFRFEDTSYDLCMAYVFFLENFPFEARSNLTDLWLCMIYS